MKSDFTKQERVAEWLRRLTHKLKIRVAEVQIPPWTDWSLSVTLTRVNQSHMREFWLLGRVDGKISMAPAGHKSLRLLQASHVKYDYLLTNEIFSSKLAFD